MNDRRQSGVRRAPWHFWLIGIVALLWSAMGAFDYIMTQTENEGYMAQFSLEQLEFYYNFPSWLVAFWAIAVWGGVIGSILLLMKKRLAVGTFLVSFLAMLITTIHNYGFSNGLEVSGSPFELIFSGVIFVVALALFLYARAMHKRNYLA